VVPGVIREAIDLRERIVSPYYRSHHPQSGGRATDFLEPLSLVLADRCFDKRGVASARRPRTLDEAVAYAIGEDTEERDQVVAS
jgi:hypothetical protein